MGVIRSYSGPHFPVFGLNFFSIESVVQIINFLNVDKKNQDCKMDTRIVSR